MLRVAMDDDIQRDIFAANRARGAIRLSADAQGGTTRRRLVDESGSLRVRFPGPAEASLLGVLVNTAGGIAGGDHFNLKIAAEEGAQLTLTSAAAEKVYRSHGPDSLIDVHLSAARGASLHWLPQETIIFDQARARRRIEADLADDAHLVLCEIAIFGRGAMGEAMQSGLFADHWRVRRAGRLIFADNVLLDGDIGATLAAPSCARGGLSVASLLVTPPGDALIENWRAMAAHGDVEMAASTWNGIALMRFCSNNSAALRNQVMAALSCCTPELPRNWLQ